MNLNRISKISGVVLATTLATGAMVPAHAAAVTIRSADFIAGLSDTRATGEYEFLTSGIRLKTTDTANTGSSQNKVAEYFSIGTGLPATASYGWRGSANQPGAQIVFDVDAISGNGNDYNVLVGEQVYSTNPAGQDLTDWWLTNGSSAAAKAVAPLTTGGSGSLNHGPLSAWKTNLPNARVIAGGFSMGSGLLGTGVLDRMTFGADVYSFAATPVVDGTDGADGADGADGQDGVNGTNGTNGTNGATGATGPAGPTGPAGQNGTITVVNAQGSYAVSKTKTRVKLTLFTTKAATKTTVTGKKVRWVVKVDGKRFAKVNQGLGAKDVVLARFGKRTGKHTVEIKRNGSVVKTVRVNSGL